MSGERPTDAVDTDELRLLAHAVCDQMDNGPGDDASDLMLAAADELDRLRAATIPDGAVSVDDGEITAVPEGDGYRLYVQTTEAGDRVSHLLSADDAATLRSALGATIPYGLREDLERRIADREPRADHYRNCGRFTEAAAVDGAISAYRDVLALLAAAPPTAEPEPDERVCPATSTRPPDDAREQYRRHRLGVPRVRSQRRDGRRVHRPSPPRGAVVKCPQRVCAQCGKVEPRWLWLSPGRMFKIWKGASHDVDLCSFECSAKWYAPKEPTRSDQYRDLLETWARWWDGPGRSRFSGHVLPPLTYTAAALACTLCAGVHEPGRCAACGRQMGGQ